MKKIIAIVLCMAAGLFMLCSCGEKVETVTHQTGNLRYDIAEGWTARTVTPAPSTAKIYNYGDHEIRIDSLSYRFYEDPLQEALDFAVSEILLEKDPGAGYVSDLASEGHVGDMPAKEIAINSTDLDGNHKLSGVFTAIETETGIYTIVTTTESEELSKEIKTAHDAVKESVEYTSMRDPEVYTKNIFQWDGYICAVPKWDTYVVDLPWWTARTEYSNGIINYASDLDATNVALIPMGSVDLTDSVIVETLAKVYNGKIGPDAKCSIVNREMMEAATGSALYVEVGLAFGEEKDLSTKSSALFIMDEEGKAVCCFTNPADGDLSYEYTGITTSIRPSGPVYAVIDSLYSKSSEYVGDNSAVGALLNDLEFGIYGDYTFELQTEKEPYGVTVNYSDEVNGYDFQREAVIMIGLIGNLDYVDIKDSTGGIVHYDYELAKSLMKYDVKKMATDKARLGAYYLETLY